MARPDSGVSGVLCVDKPLGWTSRDVVNKVGWLLGTRSAGHAGTLDPQASGVLLVAMGEATKLVRFLQDAHKSYEAEILFGSATLSDDADSPVVLTAPLPTDLGAARLKQVLDGWVGWLDQVPPQVSALQTDGVRDYDRVRRGETVLRPSRRVWLEAATVLECGTDRCRLRLTCGAGFYVRSLGRDLGTALGSAAHVLTLRRIDAGGFAVQECVTIETLIDLDPAGRMQAVVPVRDAALRVLPELAIDAMTTLLLRQGKHPPWPIEVTGTALATCDGELIAMVEGIQSETGPLLKVVRGFTSPPMLRQAPLEGQSGFAEPLPEQPLAVDESSP